jgi:hypothetical protein
MWPQQKRFSIATAKQYQFATDWAIENRNGQTASGQNYGILDLQEQGMKGR